ncbi:MAG: hypothetical protein ACSW8D_16820 [Prevotella sp.]
MNFEELLNTRDIRKTTKVRLPYGYFYKRLIDGKYSNFVEFHDDVADNIAFSSCVKRECEAVEKIAHVGQLRFTPNVGEGGIYAIAVEVGHFITMEQLLNEEPSVVARKDFISGTLRDLFDLTALLHEQEIYHVCYAPSNILVRKKDQQVCLLCHGSFYQRLDQDVLYDGVEDYVAPEVFEGGPIDARTDVYSLGKFIAWLYESSGLPMELKGVVEKATAEDPEKRYATVEAMRHAINTRRNMRRSGVMAAVALSVALIIVGLFFYLLPSPDPVEYVQPVDEPIPDEMLEEDMEALLGIGADADSAALAGIVVKEQLKNDSLGYSEGKMREYNAKAEAIFRKQFSKAADAIISSVYTPSNMSGSANAFAAKNSWMSEELAKKQKELMELSGLSSEHTQRVASEIIEQITQKKREALDKDYMGIKKQKDEQESSARRVPGDNKK